MALSKEKKNSQFLKMRKKLALIALDIRNQIKLKKLIKKRKLILIEETLIVKKLI